MIEMGRNEIDKGNHVPSNCNNVVIEGTNQLGRPASKGGVKKPRNGQEDSQALKPSVRMDLRLGQPLLDY
ncbi:hypothetical protein V6N13_069305 [Hibiscus sabdariffa]